EEMLTQARALVGEPERFHAWRAGDPPPPGLAGTGPFDAVVSLGNVWPQIVDESDVQGALAGFRRLLRPGGLVLLGLKAVAVRRESGNPYLPLLRREHEGRPLWFIRFVDFDVPQRSGGPPVCHFHLVVVGGDAESPATEMLLHHARPVRIWSPETLEGTFREAGFTDVHASARLGDPAAPPTTEDVFLHAVAPPS
ncbi:MAG: class I SAM-dependent methyltransferase, partial [Planctomycetota bacterium]